MAMYDNRVFKHRDTWWVAQVHGGGGVGVGPETPDITEETVFFTALGDASKSKVATIPAGSLNRITHRAVVGVLQAAEDFTERLDLEPVNAPDLNEVGGRDVYEDPDGLRWIIIETLSAGDRPIKSVEVICLDDSALRKDILLRAETDYADLRAVTGDAGPLALIDAVKRTFREYTPTPATPAPQPAAAVSRWLHERFPGSVVAEGRIFDRGTTLYRIALAGGKSSELEVSDEAFEDIRVTDIIADLEAHEVVSRLTTDPTMRLQYTRSRDIPHHEWRQIDCDGRRYRVVRDAGHNVRIFDASDKPLSRTPQKMLVLSVSIFHRDYQQWCNEIRSWRGDNQ